MIIKNDTWKLDTENLTVENLKTGEIKDIYGEHLKYHIHYSAENNPDRLQKLIDEGEIIEYLDELDIKIREAVMEQAEKLMNEDMEYRAAVESGNLVKVGRIGNMYTEKAREIVYPAMVYV